jgi:hypothetical protein
LATVDYSGAVLKLQRAEEHLAHLDFLIFRFLRAQPYLIEQKIDFDSGKYGFYISMQKLLPREISAVLGDAIHNFRSALDLAVCAITFAKIGRFDKNTYFPASGSKDDWPKMVIKRTKLAGDEAMQVCREQNAYPGGNDAIRGLHEADIIDKHQALIVTLGIGDFNYTLLPTGPENRIFVETRIQYLGLEPCFVPSPEGREFEHPFQIGLAVQVVFPEGTALAGKPVIAAITQIGREVRRILDEIQDRIPSVTSSI